MFEVHSSSDSTFHSYMYIYCGKYIKQIYLLFLLIVRFLVIFLATSFSELILNYNNTRRNKHQIECKLHVLNIRTIPSSCSSFSSNFLEHSSFLFLDHLKSEEYMIMETLFIIIIIIHNNYRVNILCINIQ